MNNVFFKLRLIIAEIEGNWRIDVTLRTHLFLFFSLGMKLSWNYYVIDEIMRNGRLENYEFRVIYVEVDYVDQVFLCFLVSLKFVIIGDKEN